LSALGDVGAREEWQEATEMTSAEMHMSNSNLRNGPKRKIQGNWVSKVQSSEKPQHDQQGKEKRAGKKNLTEVKCFNYDQMGHYARGCSEPKKVLHNVYQ